jgi:peptide/nickel transport system ATP-binding protein
VRSPSVSSVDEALFTLEEGGTCSRKRQTGNASRDAEVYLRQRPIEGRSLEVADPPDAPNSMAEDSPPLLDIQQLCTQFATDDGLVTAVDSVSFTIPRGKTVGLVGESGCGKSITGLSLLQLVPPPGRVAGGKILFRKDERAPPIDLAALSARGDAIRAIRGNEIAMIFQEPMTSLNPVYTIGDQIGEAMRLHQGLSRGRARQRAIEILDRVGIASPRQRVDEYPHQLSGGMRQRAMIAMALACQPALLIADEPTTALDVTIQAQILDLLRELQQQMGMAILLISHDLGVIAELAHAVIVMYAGRVVERAWVDDLFYQPLHPYTRGLLRSVPVLGGSTKTRLASIPGKVPSLLALPAGCTFRPRCADRFPRCHEQPSLTEVAPDHSVSCWLHTDAAHSCGEAVSAPAADQAAV